ncbi:uncharacterized protein LOC128746423 [Sabethes cyaneus]|uniref:uncharacterized protein LOC128746423 n=1 Tax=Sabethes cyaneus TaxID=53552 RepID=UPI00237D6286|nr:uncharacterized protein LOC128746423 [Sabethes cyaneus]
MGICPPEAIVDTTHTERDQYELNGEVLHNNQLVPRQESLTNTTTPATTTAFRRTESSITVYYQNVRGLRTKIEDLFLTVSNAEYDIIALTETWLNEEIHSVQLFGTNYTVYRNDRDPSATGKKRGGGVLIAVSSKINSSKSASRVSNSIEHLWVNVYGSGSTVAVGVVYIAPELAVETDVIEQHIESAFTITESLRSCDCHLLLGDYNQPGLVWTSSSTGFLYPDPSKSRFSTPSSVLVDGMATMDMKQINDVKNNRDRTLDLIFINAEFVPRCSVSEAVEPLIQADLFHPALVANLQYTYPINYHDCADETEFDFHKADIAALSRAIGNLNWSQLLDGSIDSAVEIFTSQMSQFFHRFVPAPRTRGKPPWSNHQLRELKRLRAAALRRYINCRNPFTKREFNFASSSYRTLNRHLYSKYVQRKETDLKRNPKSFWHFMNEKRQTSGLPTSMFLDTKVAESREAICNLFIYLMPANFCMLMI